MTTRLEDKNVHDLSNAIEALAAQHRRWEAGTYAASNAELYALLGSTLDFFIKVRRNLDHCKAINRLMDIYKLTHNSQTSLALKVVRLVFVGTDRQNKIENRAFVYCRVIEVAAGEGIIGSELPQYIVDNHGIDEIRRKMPLSSSDTKSTHMAREFAEAMLADQAELFPVTMGDGLQPVDGARFSLALVRKNDDGTGSIVFGTNNMAAVNNVLNIAGKALKANVVKRVERSVAEADADQRALNLQQLMQSLPAPKVFQPELQLPETVTLTQPVTA
ncbi:hypothetical protein Z949_612 [Sulfitobacter guttiformis KCTC 32187]|uniref:Uncharacterized protein n=2 Tax=Sulfitobacter guttiformis TaxID=74349 RepID=A0A420DUN2_9RHOB|nr:hypothetical protein Z949_612 [Sulfitobacter guttiformis KCTC 32187]RKE97893.1 hypothetical protein C8N30_2524 [Sulfitobacter guttiformis]